MTSKYPNEIDTDAELPRVFDNVSEVGSDSINSMRDSIVAIQKTIGENPQGTTANLVSRISVAINEDGTLSSSALVAAGLIALPISNSQVGGGAAISESKLDLDVATQILQDQITSNDIDIAALQKSIAKIISDFAAHVAGTDFKHGSFDILLDKSYPSSTPPSFLELTAVDVGNAILEMNNRFISHVADDAIGAHKAGNISVDGTNFSTISPSIADTQAALEALDLSRAVEIAEHRDSMHANGFDNWANDINGYNSNHQLVPAIFGSTVSATLFPSIRNKLRFVGVSLITAGVSQGDVVVIKDGYAAGTYTIDDVGPRGVGARPLLTSEELEITRFVGNVSSVPGAITDAAIYKNSSTFSFKANSVGTIYQNATLDSIQCSRPNAAKALSLGIKPLLLKSAGTLDITVGINSGLSRSISISGLDEDRTGPVSVVTLSTIVDKINSEMQGSNNFPAAAYQVGDELLVSHNWDGYEGYFVKINSSGTANDALGFDGYGANILDAETPPTKGASFYVGGERFTAFNSLYVGEGSATGSAITFSSFNPLAGGVQVGHTAQVKEHSTLAANGTYFIEGVTSTTITLNTTIATDIVEVEIQNDTAALDSLAGGGNSQLIEVFVDKTARLGFNVRTLFDNTIVNLDLVDISDNFIPGEFSLYSELLVDGHNLFIDDDNVGLTTFVPFGFVGKKKIWMTSNVEFIVVDIVGALGVSPFGGSSLKVEQHVNEEEVLEICSARSSGSNTLFDIVDKRMFGSVGLDEIREDVIQAYIETPLADLRSNGIVRGFELPDLGGEYDGYFSDFVFPNNGALLIRGGSAYVNGVSLDVRTQAVIFPVPTSSTTFTICLKRTGDFELIDDSDFSFADILNGLAGSVAPIYRIEHNGSGHPYPLSNPTDVRKFINDLDDKIELILDSTNHMVGNFATIDAALSYANNYPHSEKFKIRVVSRDDMLDIIIPTGSRDISLELDGYIGNLTIQSDCKVYSQSIYDRGQAHISGSLTVESSCENFELVGVKVEGLVSLEATAAGLSSFSSCVFENTFTSIANGEAIKFFDCRFDGASNGLVHNGAADLYLDRTIFKSGGLDIVDGGSPGKLFIGNCIFEGANASAEIISIDNLYGSIQNSIFRNTIGKIILKDGEISGCLFDNCDLNNDVLIDIDSAADEWVTISNCHFSNFSINSSESVVSCITPQTTVSNCVFQNLSSSSSTAIFKVDSFKDNKFLGGAGDYIVTGKSINGNIGLHGVITENADGFSTNYISENIFEATRDALVEQVNYAYSSFVNPETIKITKNIFKVGDSQYGIYVAGYQGNVYIEGNTFEPDGASPISAIFINSGAEQHSIIGNTVQDGHTIPFLTSGGSLADISITDNNIGDSIFSVAVSSNSVFSRNFGDGAATFTGAISNFSVSENNLKAGLTIGSSSLTLSSISNNKGILNFPSSLENVSISNNNVDSMSASASAWDSVVFVNNLIESSVTDFSSIVWANSIINDNLFRFGMTFNFLDSASASSVTGNLFSGNVTLTSSGSISEVLFADNFSVDGTAALTVSAPFNKSFISRNFEFSITLSQGSSSSAISGNVLSSTDITTSGSISGTNISNNICRTIDVRNSATVSGCSIENNTIFSDLRITSAASTASKTISSCNFSNNQITGSFYLGSESLSNGATWELSDTQVLSNSVGTNLSVCSFSAMGTSPAPTVTFEDCVFSRNKVGSETDFFNSQIFSNGSVNNITISEHETSTLDIGVNDESDLVLTNITIQDSVILTSVLFDDFLFSNFTFKGNQCGVYLHNLKNETSTSADTTLYEGLNFNSNSFSSSAQFSGQGKQDGGAGNINRVSWKNFYITDNNFFENSLSLTISTGGGWGGLDGGLTNLVVSGNTFENFNIFEFGNSATGGESKLANINIANNSISGTGGTQGILISANNGTIHMDIERMSISNNTVEDFNSTASLAPPGILNFFSDSSATPGSGMTISNSNISGNAYFDIQTENRVRFESTSISGNKDISFRSIGSASNSSSFFDSAIINNLFFTRPDTSKGAFTDVSTASTSNMALTFTQISGNVFDASRGGGGGNEPLMSIKTNGQGFSKCLINGNTFRAATISNTNELNSAEGTMFSNNLFLVVGGGSSQSQWRFSSSFDSIWKSNSAQSASGTGVYLYIETPGDMEFSGNRDVQLELNSGVGSCIMTGNSDCDIAINGDIGLIAAPMIFSSNKDSDLNVTGGGSSQGYLSFTNNSNCDFDIDNSEVELNFSNNVSCDFTGSGDDGKVTANGNFKGDIDLRYTSLFAGTISSNNVNSIIFNPTALAAAFGGGSGSGCLKIIGNTTITSINTTAAYTTTGNDLTFFWGNTSGSSGANLTVAGTAATNIITANATGNSPGIINN